jgi:hypothetical protein
MTDKAQNGKPGWSFRTFRLPKKGNDPKECEDFCGCHKDTDTDQGRFAVADGASESSFAEPWARGLVTKFLKDPVLDNEQWAAWLPSLQRKFCEAVDALELSWFAKEKADQGAFASFLGLVLEHDWTWRAIAVGDCCLFRVADGRLTHGFPLTKSSQFGVTPALIGARLPPDDIVVNNKGRTLHGTFGPGDIFYMMSDALAQWFLKTWERTKRVPDDAAPIDAADIREFAEGIAYHRDNGSLKDDDVTLVVIEVKLK